MPKCPFCHSEIIDLTAHLLVKKRCRVKALAVARAIQEWLASWTKYPELVEVFST
jgi:hypothetical protein